MDQNILVVDDSPAIFKLLKKELEKNGFKNIEYAENGEVAVQKFVDWKPDLIIMDITMPIMDGIEASQRILDIDKDAKIILLSSMNDDLLMEEAKVMGVKYFLSKPVNMYHLFEKLFELLDSV